MPYGMGRMLRLRRGMGGGLVGCPRRMPFGWGLIGTAASIVASLALNDLAKPDGYLRGVWRRLIKARSSVRVIGYDAPGDEKVSIDSAQAGDRALPGDTGKEE